MKFPCFLPTALLAFIAALGFAPCASAQTAKKEPREFLPPPFDRYIQRRVQELSSAKWQDSITRENWPETRATLRRQLQRMLGLDPWPERGPLNAVVTGSVDGDGYVVEKLHFQSSPGLYVTGNLYRPKEVTQPLPAILYVCGHSDVVENGVSLGNKTGYQHHGIWFARHGYVCLVLDTIQLGEIRGDHHGTHRFGRWWWAARGYTPAGVEAWNGIRALDYLETRPEVDRTRIGMTGRSGGGAYTWWVAALDERIKVAVPTAGITTLHNHVIDGAIEGHCDCMFMVNTERWDFDRVAALMAPRPLLIANTDSDPIFPLDGVMQIFNRTRALYRKLGAEDQIGLHIAEGPHKDTQPLNTGAFHWLNRFLKGADRMDLTREPAEKALQPSTLKVFTELPKDEKVTKIDETFVPAFAAGSVPSAAEWPMLRDSWMRALRQDSFQAWPTKADASARDLVHHTSEGLRLTECTFESEPAISSRIWLLHREELKLEEAEGVVLNVLDEKTWDGFHDQTWYDFRRSVAPIFPRRFPGAVGEAKASADRKMVLLRSKTALAFFSPRGVGEESIANVSPEKQKQLRRRLLLLGETLESGQVWDIQQAASALRSIPGLTATPLSLAAGQAMAANTLYASLFIPSVHRLTLHQMPRSHREGPTYLNVLRYLDLPQAVALAAERSKVELFRTDSTAWRYPQEVIKLLGLPGAQLQLVLSNPPPALPADESGVGPRNHANPKAHP